MKAKNNPCRTGHVYTDYYASGRCGTPYCYGWTELHCSRCGWYTVSCPCGSNDGASKISYAQQRSIDRRIR
jgi:hypothetical protein